MGPNAGRTVLTARTSTTAVVDDDGEDGEEEKANGECGLILGVSESKVTLQLLFPVRLYRIITSPSSSSPLSLLSSLLMLWRARRAVGTDTDIRSTPSCGELGWTVGLIDLALYGNSPRVRLLNNALENGEGEGDGSINDDCYDDSDDDDV